MVDDDIEIPAMDIVSTDQLGLVGLGDGRLQALTFTDEFAAHIDEARMGAHCETGEQAALDQVMGLMAQDLAVLTRAGLGFVRIDDEIGWARVGLGHERPF